MLKKNNSNSLFSFEEHKETETLPEQGTVVEAEVEDVVVTADPSDDSIETGDGIGETSVDKDIDVETDTDITTNEPVIESTDNEISKLTEDGASATATKDKIVATATAEVMGDQTEDTDVNGNVITPEQAIENEAEEEIEEIIEDEAAKSVAEKDLDEQVDDINSNVDEELSDSIGDVSTDSDLDTEATDDTVDDVDSSGDQGDLGMDSNAGSVSDPTEDDDELDETPLDGSSDDSVTVSTVESDDGDVSTPELDEGTDLDTIESNDGGELDKDDTFDDVTDDSETTTVADKVAKQNKAAEVTAEAASADAEQTEFIADEMPEQHGEELTVDEVPDNDGEEVIAEAIPAIQNQEDVSTANANADITQSTVDEVDLDDDTPLEGSKTEDLDVEVKADLTPTEVDGQEVDGPTDDGATVEESQSDQQSEELDEKVDKTTEETIEVEELDTDSGEIEVTEKEADLEEGELDIPDVDDETTEEEVEEAEIEADVIESEADAEERQADDADKTIEELQKEAEALEEFRTIIEYSIATENYSPQLLAYFIAKTEKIRGVLNGIGYNIPAVSLEEYSSKDMDLAYKVTLESIRGFISRISGLNGQLIQKTERWYSKGMVDKIKTRTSALNKQIDLCLVQLKDSSVANKEINAIGAYLAYADGNLVKSVSDDLKLVTDVGIKGFKATEDLQSNLVKALNDITASATPAEATDIADKVSRFKDTKTAFPSRAFSHGFLGGYKFELKEASGGDNLKDKILNMGRRAVPVVVKTGKGEETSQKLSKGDLVNLLKMAKAYVAFADKLASTVGDRAVDNVSKLRLTRERALPIVVEGRIRGGDERAIDSAASALEIVAKAHNDLYKFITKHSIDVADALCGVAKKFIK